jgi:hypothetical protein
MKDDRRNRLSYLMVARLAKDVSGIGPAFSVFTRIRGTTTTQLSQRVRSGGQRAVAAASLGIVEQTVRIGQQRLRVRVVIMKFGNSEGTSHDESPG